MGVEMNMQQTLYHLKIVVHFLNVRDGKCKQIYEHKNFKLKKRLHNNIYPEASNSNHMDTEKSF